MFVCLGNICRSPMAEFVFNYEAKNRGVLEKYEVASAGTCEEEEGSPVHYGTVAELKRRGVPFRERRAVLLRAADYDRYDLFIGMDESNVRCMKRLFDGDPYNKVKLLNDYTGNPRDVADPWYTGNFVKTYDDIRTGIECLLDNLEQEVNV